MQSTVFTGLLLLLAGGFLALVPALAEPRVKAFPRSRIAAFLVFGVASAWFLLVYVANLGPADFGEYRKFLFGGFALIAILSFSHVPDFLSVRGAAALMLLYAAQVLDSAYGMPQATRLFLVTFIYLGILAALYLGAVPYRLRDFFEWLFRASWRARAFGGTLAICGLLLLLMTLTY